MERITTPSLMYAPPADRVLYTSEARLDHDGRYSVVPLVQFDDRLPVLAVKLFCRDTPYAVPEGAAVNMRMRKPDGTHVYNPALGLSADRMTAYIAITMQVTAVAGMCKAVLEIVVGEKTVGTAPIWIKVRRNPVPEKAIESQDEFLRLEELVAMAALSAEKASKSAEAAKASQTGAEKSKTDADKSATAASGSAAAAAQSAADAETSAKKAQEAADVTAHPPEMRSDHWWTWDAKTGGYTDTGVDVGLSLQVSPDTVTGEPGSNAGVKNIGTETDPILQFTLPRGDKGAKGDQGAKGDKGEPGDTGPQGAVGPQGPTGPAPTVKAVAAGTIGTPGTPTVTASQSGNTVTLTFDHLKGAVGAAGPQGAKGDTGAAGATGPQGPAGPAGPNGPQGPAGPNTVSTSTGTNITGLLKGDGKAVAQAKAGTDYVLPSGSITGNAGTATKLAATKNINGVPFDGSKDITVYDSTKVAKTGDTMTGDLTLSGASRAIKYASGTRTNAPISFYAGDVNGSGIVIGDGGRTIIGGGESAQSLRTALGTGTTKESAEEMHVASDGSIFLHTNCQTIGSRKTVTINGSGNVSAPGGFSGSLSGKATSAGTADKVGHSLKFTGGSTAAFDGSADQTVAIPKTAADVGAVAKTGDTVTGALTIRHDDASLSLIDPRSGDDGLRLHVWGSSKGNNTFSVYDGLNGAHLFQLNQETRQAYFAGNVAAPSFAAESRVDAGSKMNIRTDDEGGNLTLVSKDGQRAWEMDDFGGYLRIYCQNTQTGALTMPLQMFPDRVYALGLLPNDTFLTESLSVTISAGLDYAYLAAKPGYHLLSVMPTVYTGRNGVCIGTVWQDANYVLFFAAGSAVETTLPIMAVWIKNG